MINTQILEQIAQEYLDEKHLIPEPEHYRYRVFRRFMDRSPGLPELHFDAILTLTEFDPELQQIIISDLMDRPECPLYIYKRIAKSYPGAVQERAKAYLESLSPEPGGD